MQPQDVVVAFARRDAASGDQVIVLANREDRAVDADVAPAATWTAPAATDRLSGERVVVADGRLRVAMPPKSVRILVPANP